ncbi:MAG TPA: alginate lyase family protein, partial [Limnochordia bacterium]
DVEAVRRQAEAVLARRFDVPIWGRVELPREIPWHRDLPSGREWPRRFAPAIDYRHAAPGDIRAVWELARHQHLITLAEAYFLTGERRYVEDLSVQWRHWARENPIDIGVHWVSPMEAALRLISWIWVLAFLTAAAQASDGAEGVAAREALLRSLPGAILQHAEHVRRHHARFSSANNHALIEATALIAAGALFSPWEPAPRWLEVGLRILARELPRQIHPDGVNAEQSTHYHAFTLEALLFVVALARKNGLALPPEAEGRVGRMAAFLRVLVDREGGIPAIGDGDEGRILPFAPEPAQRVWRLLILAGALFKRPDWVAAGLTGDRAAGALAFWVVGESAFAAGQGESRVAGATECRSQVFPAGGYAVFRAEASAHAPEAILTFDAGPLGLGRLAAHGHADALSVTLRVNGRPVLIDPGTGAYHGDVTLRDRLRTAAAHNTLVVEGREQAVPLGPFLWGRRPHVSWEAAQVGAFVDGAVGSHDGYGVRHRRGVLFVRPCHWMIVDWLEGTAAEPLSVSVQYQLDRELEIDFPSEGIWSGAAGEPLGRAWVRDGAAALALGVWFAPPATGRWSVVREQGMVSPRLGIAEEALRLCLRGVQTPPLTAVTVLSLNREAVVERTGPVVSLAAGGRVWHLVPGACRTKAVTFEGRLALVETPAAETTPVRCFTIQGKRLRWYGEELFVTAREGGEPCAVRVFRTDGAASA